MKSVPDTSPILVVDDDAGLLLSIKATLLSAGLPEPDVTADSRQVMDMFRAHPYRIVLLDLVMPYLGGMELLEKIKAEFPETVCLIVTANDEVSAAIQAIKLGASDYLVKPINSANLIEIVQRSLDRYAIRKEAALFASNRSFSDLAHPEAFQDIVAEDESMSLVFHQIEAVAPTDYSVIISGESGTGKELMARMIHKLSKRNTAPFIAVNMAAFTQTLFEDDFFGHAKGAYTHAVNDKRGFFEEAHGGTLFLDEISELDMSLQGKLLRVLQEKEFYRLGSTSSQQIDVRILAATNRNILDDVKQGRFRADLFYRLSMYSVRIPPLRERKDDIIPLARHFVRMYGRRLPKPIERISAELERKLPNYPFSGNIRELENMMASAVLLEKSRSLTSPSVIGLNASAPDAPDETPELMTLEEIEKQHILRVLQKTQGNRIKAAHILGINTATIYRKIEKYRIAAKPEKQTTSSIN